MTDKLPEIMTKLQQQMGREPPATVTHIEDYAPKDKDIRAQQISAGLREAMQELQSVQVAQREKIDEQAELLAQIHNIIEQMKNTNS